MRLKSLQDLASLEIKEKKKQKPIPVAAPVISPQPTPQLNTENGEAMFGQAMLGVAPLQGKGREVPLEIEPAMTAAALSSDDSVQALKDIVEGKTEFSIEFSDEYVQGHLLGLNNKILNELKSGHYSPEANLDLHGKNVDQSYDALIGFIRENFRLGRRCLLVITGRGINSPQGQSVLKEEVQHWLTREPLKRVIIAFSSAQPKHGGAGALYVLLRKFKKSQGKIIWERWT